MSDGNPHWQSGGESAPKPDWYTDPGGSGGERFWDGVQWTEQTRPAGGFTTAPAPPPQYVPQAPYQPAHVSAKSPGVAVLLSIVWLGAGHFYAGRSDALPIIMAVVNLVLWSLAFVIVGFFLWIPAVIWMSIEASNAAKDFNRRHGLQPS